MKCNNIHIIGTPGGEESDQGLENLFEEIMTENFPNLVKDKFIKVQEILDTVLVNPVPAHKVSSNIYWKCLKPVNVEVQNLCLCSQSNLTYPNLSFEESFSLIIIHKY